MAHKIDVHAHIVDIINNPHRTSQTWACNCGKTKYNHQETETTSSTLVKMADNTKKST